MIKTLEDAIAKAEAARINRIEHALQVLNDLHNCKSVQCADEQCPICAMHDILKETA